MFLCGMLATACSTGYKTGKKNLTFEKTITVFDDTLQALQPEKEFLLSDHVPQCCATVLYGDQIACTASFGSGSSYLWWYEPAKDSIPRITIPYAPVTGMQQYDQRFAMMEYRETGSRIVLAGQSFMLRREINFPYTAHIPPIIYMHEQQPAVLWTEKNNGRYLLRTAYINNENIVSVTTLAETGDEIYEIAVSPGATPYFAYTAGEEINLYLIRPGEQQPARLFPNAANLNFFNLGNKLFLSAVSGNNALLSSQLIITKISGGEQRQDTLISLQGYTALFRVQPLQPGKQAEEIYFSVITENKKGSHRQGMEAESFSNYLICYHTATERTAVLGKLAYTGLLHQNGYVNNNRLVLLQARERIYLLVFNLEHLN